MSYSLIRFLLEFIRTDEFGTGNIRYNQVAAAAVFVLSFIWLIYLIICSKGLKDCLQSLKALKDWIQSLII